MQSYIKILCVRLSVCLCVTDVGVAVTNLRVMCKTITCVSAFTEMAIIFLEIVKAAIIFLEIVKAAIIFLEIVEDAAGLDTLRCRLREGCHYRHLPSHWRRARTKNYLVCWTRTRPDFSLSCHSVQRARQPLSPRAISMASFTVAGT